MANIGFISWDSLSPRSTGYPHLRENVPILWKLKQEGHMIYLLYPNLSNQKWIQYQDTNLRAEKLPEWFQYLTVLNSGATVDGTENTPPRVDVSNDCMNLDVLYVATAPFQDRYNYNFVDYILKWIPKVKKVIWVVQDFELENQNAKSVLYQLMPKQCPELKDKIRVLFYAKREPYLTAYPDSRYFPHAYCPYYEIPIEELRRSFTEKKRLSDFYGPVSYRFAMTKYFPALDEVALELNLKNEFWNEKRAAKQYRNESNVNMFQMKDVFHSFEVYDAPVYLDYKSFRKKLGEVFITLHDSIFAEQKDDPYIAGAYSHKINDALYSGVIPFTTDFLDCDEIFKGMASALKLNSGQEMTDHRFFQSVVRKLVSSSDYYFEMLQTLRTNMNAFCGIDKQYDLHIKDIF